jgi:predicted amidohydrolase YtcJ
MHVAVNRTGFPSAEGPVRDDALTVPFVPEEAIDLAVAIEAFTMGSAHVNHLDDLTGSITPGKYADLVVLDRNLFDLPTSDIYQARAQLTMVEGVQVFGSEDLEGAASA